MKKPITLVFLLVLAVLSAGCLGGGASPTGGNLALMITDASLLSIIGSESIPQGRFYELQITITNGKSSKTTHKEILDVKDPIVVEFTNLVVGTWEIEVSLFAKENSETPYLIAHGSGQTNVTVNDTVSVELELKAELGTVNVSVTIPAEITVLHAKVILVDLVGQNIINPLTFSGLSASTTFSSIKPGDWPVKVELETSDHRILTAEQVVKIEAGKTSELTFNVLDQNGDLIIERTCP